MAKRGKYKSNLRGYPAYSQLFDTQQQKLAAQGLTMRQQKLTKQEWENVYTAFKNDREDEIRDNKRKTIGDINRSIVQRQTFEYSKKQAKNLKEALINGINKKLDDPNLSDMQREQFEEVKRQITGKLTKSDKQKGLDKLYINQIRANQYAFQNIYDIKQEIKTRYDYLKTQKQYNPDSYREEYGGITPYQVISEEYFFGSK